MNLVEFISAYRKNLALLTDNITSGNLKLIESNLERLEEIERQLSITSYRLVFIGEPGSGKTTTICNYLNLTRDIKTGEEFKGFELFDTASGRTTAFEVHYHRADYTGFEIQPMELSQQFSLIKEYCEYIWQLAFEGTEIDDKDTDSQEHDTSIEHERIIRNMLGFSKDDEVKQYVSEHYGKAECEHFVQEMFKKSHITSRTCTKLSCPIEENAKKWMKSTFSDINKGKNPDVAIPERVDVFLNFDDLEYYMPDFVSEVIDTRGYDGNAREDLRAYIQAKDTLSVILDEVETLPGERQSKILSEWLDSKDTDAINRISLMIKVKNDSLSNVNDADDDPEKGEELKREELNRAIVSKKLCYNPQNTLFIDSYEGIGIKVKYAGETKKRKIKTIDEFDEEVRQSEQQRITKHFSQIIEYHRKQLAEEAEKLRKDTEQLFAVISTPSEIKLFSGKLEHTKTRLSTLRDTLIQKIKDIFFRCEKRFCQYFRKNIHWRSAKATVSRFGTWYKANIYAEYMQYCENLVKSESSSIKLQMCEYIENLKDCDNLSDEMVAFVDSCLTKIDIEYRRLIDSVRNESKKLCENALTNSFWQETQNINNGAGYYDRLMDEISYQMITASLSKATSSQVQNLVNHFFEEIILVLKNESDSL